MMFRSLVTGTDPLNVIPLFDLRNDRIDNKNIFVFTVGSGGFGEVWLWQHAKSKEKIGKSRGFW